jgi:hypothetical protein
MDRISPRTPHPEELTRRVKVFPVIQGRKKSVANIWFFDSPKNQKRFAISGDLLFMSFVLLEGDPTVHCYDPSPSSVIVMRDREPTEVTAGAYVYLNDGQKQWWDFRYEGKKSISNNQELLSKLAAKNNGMEYHIQEEREVRNKQVLFDNWLNLCAGINRCRSIILHREIDCILKETQDSEISFRELMEMADDRALMFAAIATSLQRGVIFTNLENQLLGNQTILKRR